MPIEHFAFNVEDPAAIALWYKAHLGMRVVRKSDEPPHTHFLADSGGGVLIEFYHNTSVKVPDYRQMDPLMLHVAFAARNIASERTRLLAAGATAVGEIVDTPAGDQLAMLRDPWGFAVQLVKRARVMV